MMITPSSTKWKYDQMLEGLLYFAQRIEEQLFDFTLDTYKAPALNSYFRCLELAHALDNVKNNKLKRGNIKAIIDELTHSFEADTIIQKIFGKHYSFHLEKLRSDNNNLHELEIHISHIIDNLKDSYYKTLKAELSNAVMHNKEKEKINNYSMAFLTHLINSGYDSTSLYFQTKKFFFEDDAPIIREAKQISDFLDKFSFENKIWEVLFKVNKAFTECREILSQFDAEIHQNAPAKRAAKYYPEEQFLVSGSDEVFLLFKKIEAYDSATARRAAEKLLEVLSNLIRYHSHKKETPWSDDALVYETPNNYVNKVQKAVSPVFKRSEAGDHVLKHQITETFGKILKLRLEPESMILLFRSLDLHALAIESKSPENQLLNFWTAIEALVPATDDEAKIARVVNVICPVLSYRYPVKLFYDLLQQIRNQDKAILDVIDKDVITGDNQFEKLSALVALDDLQAVRKKVYAALSDKPLLKNRIYRLHEMVSSSDVILRLHEAHYRKIGWHLQRIYRTRNSIVHSGERMPYLDILVENAHSYVDRVFETMLEKFNQKINLKSIGGAFLDIKFDYQAHMRLLAKAGQTKCDKDNFKQFLYGNLE